MDPMIGRRVGNYRLTQHLGSGGMGMVYLAERADEQFKKQVAIKLVQPDLASSRALERFQLERQMLAALDHPNIVRLLDAGTTEEGVPYVVMDYVDGVPILEYCNSHRLRAVGRLKLFRMACGAVHHAHQNLLVHRDIKPSNILVTKDGVPKLLDFGIAKLLGKEHAPEPRDVTGAGPHPMTLKYASPEQLRGEPITIASDVYSLGVLLYELLAGQYPYSKSATPWALVHAICETEPEKPSASVLTVPETRPSDISTPGPPLAAHGPSDERPQQLKRRLEGDLDAVILKAMHKIPRQRYASAEHLSEDIRRHLEGFPVFAREHGFTYRGKKFVARHRIGVAAAVMATLSLLGGLVAATYQAHIANAERAKAERRFNDVRELANSIIFELNDAIRDLPGSTEAQKLLVTKASSYLDKLAREAKGDASLGLELAEAYVKLGNVQGNPYFANLGDSEGAAASYRKALENAESVSRAQPANTTAKRTLGRCYQHLSDVLPIVGKPAEAVASQRKALEIFAALSAADPASDAARTDLASCYEALGDLLQAPGHLSLGDASGALDSYEKSLLHWEALVASDPINRRARRAVGGLNMKIAGVLADWDDRQAAHAKYRKAIEILEGLSATDPTNASTRRILASAYRRLGTSLAETGEVDAALANYREASSTYEALATADPSNAQARMDRAVVLRNIAELQEQTGNLTGAMNGYAHILEIVEALSKADPTNVERRAQVAEMLMRLGGLRARMGDGAEAHKLSARGLALNKEMAERSGATADEVGRYALALLTCEPAELRSPSVALRFARQAHEMTGGTDINALDTLARAYFQTGNAPRAIELVQKALGLLPPPKPGAKPSATRQMLEDRLRQYQKQ